MKYLIIALFVLLTTGCETLAGIATKAADISDEALIGAEFTICNAASVGSIQRRYNTQDLLKARQTLCAKSIEIISNE